MKVMEEPHKESLELNEHSDAKGNPYGQNKTKIEENI
jgi:hypothetical protein